MIAVLALIVLVFFSSKVFCSLQPLPDELSSRLSLAECVAGASDVFFREGEILLVSLPINEVNTSQASATVFDRLLFYELFNRSHLSVIIKKTTISNKNENYQKPIDSYVIQVRRLTELKANLNTLKGSSTWNPHARFVIVSVAIYKNTTSAATEIIQQVWDAKIVNAVILLPSRKNSSIFEVFTWFPFSSSNYCENRFDGLQIIDRCSFGALEIGEEWFPNKIPHNLNGFPINVRVVVWPPYVLPPTYNPSNSEDPSVFNDGLEILQMNTMSGMANFSVSYSTSEILQDWGSISRNGTATGTLLHLINEEVDIAIGSFAASIETHAYFDSIIYAMPESLTWCVPHASNIPHWQNVLVIMSVDIWVLLFISYICESLCIWTVGVLRNNESTSYKSLSSCFQNVLSVTLNMAVTIQPKSLTVRLLFLMWIFLSVHLDVVYQTSLISVFTKPKYQQQITTFNDIFENKLKMWFLPTTRRYFTSNDDWVSKKVLDEWRDCEDIAVCLKRTAFYKDSAMCTPRMYLKYIKNLYVTQSKQPLLYCFKDTVVTYPLEMLLRKGFPLKTYFTNLVGSITSSGLMAHWEKKIYEAEMNNATGILSFDNQNRMPILTLDHLNFIFILLIIGQSLGFVVLLIELHLYSKCLKR